ncbi:unnamed protein product [Ceratitis capitata]|uniref:Gustatory receptor n=1 Tax=Ceratitis capitata TaxID=7213 RepID=A0A811UPV2_CERCA|nr:unnamed protein product [Ceratitis capitata]
MWLDAAKKLFCAARKSVANTCVSTQLLLSTAFGLFPYKYNSKTRRLTTAKWLKYYWVLVNIVMVLITVYLNFFKRTPSATSFIIDKPLNKLLAYIHFLLGLVVFVVISSANFRHRAEVLILHNAILQLQQQQQRWQRARFENYIIAKNVMTFLQAASNVHAKLGFNPNPSFKYVCFTILTICVKNITLFTVSNFFLTLLYIYRLLQQLNWNFKEVVSFYSLRARDVPETVPMEDMTEIAFDLKFATPCKKTSVECTGVDVAAIAELCRQYVRICQLIRRMLPKELFSPTLFLELFFINVLDLCCYMVICERSMMSAKETSFILHQLCRLEELPDEIRNEIEMLSIFMAGETIRIRFCGLLEWNFRTGASFMIATILYLIVLVQFDYYNL